MEAKEDDSIWRGFKHPLEDDDMASILYAYHSSSYVILPRQRVCSIARDSASSNVIGK
jgi:hypothetical protein